MENETSTVFCVFTTEGQPGATYYESLHSVHKTEQGAEAVLLKLWEDNPPSDESWFFDGEIRKIPVLK